MVSVGRFVDGLRQASGIAAGLAQMDWRRYLAFNGLGSAVWVAVWVFAGYFAGNHIAGLYGGLERYGAYLLATAAAVAVAVAVAVGLVLRRRQQAPAEC